MAKEGEPNFGEKSGATIRNLGIVGGVIGAIAWLAESSWTGEILVGSAITIVTGETLRRLSGKKK